MNFLKTLCECYFLTLLISSASRWRFLKKFLLDNFESVFIDIFLELLLLTKLEGSV